MITDHAFLWAGSFRVHWKTLSRENTKKSNQSKSFLILIQLYVQKTRSWVYWNGCLKHLFEVLESFWFSILSGDLLRFVPQVNVWAQFSLRTSWTITFPQNDHLYIDDGFLHGGNVTVSYSHLSSLWHIPTRWEYDWWEYAGRPLSPPSPPGTIWWRRSRNLRKANGRRLLGRWLAVHHRMRRRWSTFIMNIFCINKDGSYFW